MASPNTERNKKEIFKLNRPDINPTTGGPISKPIIPMEETAAIATGGAIVPDLPAALKTSGTAGDTPAPTKNIPMVAVIKWGANTASARPLIIKKPEANMIL